MLYDVSEQKPCANRKVSRSNGLTVTTSGPRWPGQQTDACPTTGWCLTSFWMVKVPRPRSPKRAQKLRCVLGAHALRGSAARIVVTVHSSRVRPRWPGQQTDACPTTGWYRASFWMVKVLRLACLNARRSSDACLVLGADEDAPRYIGKISNVNLYS